MHHMDSSPGTVSTISNPWTYLIGKSKEDVDIFEDCIRIWNTPSEFIDIYKKDYTDMEFNKCIENYNLLK